MCFWYLWIKTHTPKIIWILMTVKIVVLLRFLASGFLRTVINVEYPPIAVDPLLPTRLQGKTWRRDLLKNTRCRKPFTTFWSTVRSDRAKHKIPLSFKKQAQGGDSTISERTGKGPRSFGSSEPLLRCCTGTLSLGSSCSAENTQDVSVKHKRRQRRRK